jgi:hypothetical protein
MRCRAGRGEWAGGEGGGGAYRNLWRAAARVRFVNAHELRRVARQKRAEHSALAPRSFDTADSFEIDVGHGYRATGRSDVTQTK